MYYLRAAHKDGIGCDLFKFGSFIDALTYIYAEQLTDWMLSDTPNVGPSIEDNDLLDDDFALVMMFRMESGGVN